MPANKKVMNRRKRVQDNTSAIMFDDNRNNAIDNSREREYDNGRRKRSNDGLRLKLHIEETYKNPGYVYRWVKGIESRLMAAYDDDWNYVENSELAKRKGSKDTRVSVVTGVLESGEPRRDYLMEKKREWHEQDQYERVVKPTIDLEDQIKKGTAGGLKDNEIYHKNIKIQG